MPPQDSQAPAETSSDRIITFAKDDFRAQEYDDEQHDFPPESFWLSKDAELDWFDRKDSTKANINHNNINTVSNSSPPYQRLSVTEMSKTSIIGLRKPQPKPHFVDARHRRNQTNTRLFPKPGAEDNSGKQDAPMAEPSSPKVSCIGRVRSRRDRNRRQQNRQRLIKSSSTSEKPPPTATTEKRRKKKGLWRNLRSEPVPEPDSQKAQATTKTKSASRSHMRP